MSEVYVRSVREGADRDALDAWLAANHMRHSRWYTEVKIDGGTIMARRVIPVVPGDPSKIVRKPGPNGGPKTVPVWHELEVPLPDHLVSGWTEVVDDGPARLSPQEAVDRVRALHHDDGNGFCVHCIDEMGRVTFPCPTAEAIGS